MSDTNVRPTDSEWIAELEAENKRLRESVQAVAERLRAAAEANQENDRLYTGAITKRGAGERTYWDGRAAAFIEAANQLILLCNRGSNDA